MPEKLIRHSGNYRKLLSYQKTEVLSVLALMMGIAMFISCSDDKETTLLEPQELMNEEPVASHSTGQGEGTAEAPFVAEASSPAEVTLVHKSTYNDPDGTTYTCEPKATILVTTAKAEVQAKTIAELTDIKVSMKSDTKGPNPLVRHTEQTFTVGGQTITFDLTNEIYTHTDSRNRTFEMPYTRLSTAKYGAAQADEATRSERTIAVTGIRLVPVAPSRGSITTEQAYRVSVAFTVDTQTENTDDPTKTTYSFLAEYDATVETTTEYPDPSLSFSYHADATQGSNSTKSPWMMNTGMNAMTIQWDQQAAYTYFDTNEMATKVVSRTPNAAVSVSALKDTLWVSDLADLEKITAVEPIITTEGENPLKNIGKASFTSGEQVIDVEWNYESYPTVEIDGKEIAWPYIVLGTPEVVNVSVTEKKGVKVPGKDAKVFEVTARIKQNLSTANISEDQKVSEDVQYIVRYYGVLEVELVEVKYRKEYEWLEPHDNIPLTSQYIIYRDRTYSTGEVFSDVFTSMNCPVENFDFIGTYNGGGMQSEDKEMTLSDGTPILYHKNYRVNDEEYRYRLINGTKTGVPDLSKVDVYVALPEDYAITPGDFAKYHALGGVMFDSENPQDEWYFRDIGRGQVIFLRYMEGIEADWEVFREYNLGIRFYDRFRYLDGQIIDFLDYKMTYDFDFRSEDITMPDGAPAKVFTHECKAQYLGRDFYVAEIDTVYQRNFQP